MNPHETVNFFHKQQYIISCLVFSPFFKFCINTAKQLSDIMPFHMEIFQCAFLTDKNCLAKSHSVITPNKVNKSVFKYHLIPCPYQNLLR